MTWQSLDTAPECEEVDLLLDDDQIASGGRFPPRDGAKGGWVIEIDHPFKGDKVGKLVNWRPRPNAVPEPPARLMARLLWLP